MTKTLTTPNGTPASRFAFGTMQFGGKADEAASAEMFDACIEAGINHFDTAYVYTGGASETILGKLARARRDDLIIATKAAYDRAPTRKALLGSVDTSRKRLRMDTLDALYLHRLHPEAHLPEAFETMAELRATGVIRYVGVSNFAAWQVADAVHIAAQYDLPITLLQPMYNLVKRQAEVEILPMAHAFGLAVAPYSPLGGGLLTGKYAGGETGRLTEDARYKARYDVPGVPEAAAALSRIAEEIGTSPATLAVAWVAKHPGGLHPIVSARSAKQLAPSLAALRFEMDDALYARLSALIPTPPPATDRTEEHT